MKLICHIALFVLSCTLCSGCARQDVVEAVEPLVGECWPGAIAFSSFCPRMGKSDLLYLSDIVRYSSDSLYNEAFCRSLEKVSLRDRGELCRAGWFAGSNHERVEISGLRPEIDCACAKRKAALLWARCKFTYEFGSYYHLDGVSGVIYNVCYIASIPRKLIAYLRSADGIGGYIYGIGQLLFGLLCAVIGCVLSFVVNLLCHPLETASNLTIGIFYFSNDWIGYVVNTNLIASLWDLIWGGIVYPLLKALMFWA